MVPNGDGRGTREEDVLIVDLTEHSPAYAMTFAGDQFHSHQQTTPLTKRSPAETRLSAAVSAHVASVAIPDASESTKSAPRQSPQAQAQAKQESNEDTVSTKYPIAEPVTDQLPHSCAPRQLSLRPKALSLPSRSSSSSVRSRPASPRNAQTSAGPSPCDLRSDDSLADQQLQEFDHFPAPEHGLVDSVHSRCQSQCDNRRIQDFEERWMLNMSIQFRDRSGREKFFVTYAESSKVWRRLTISVKYADAPEDSLEAELHDLHFQRDKSHCIFDALRESLPTIQFFDTVTNLKLVTDPLDGQLHVHVREDTNEAIDFPAASMFEHIQCPSFREGDLVLYSHISGFVYKVAAQARLLVKKDIPGRDSVEEFMYELNALNSLRGSPDVIQLCGLVTDDGGRKVKGLLIEYAAGGSLADMLFDVPRSQLSCERREKWARQITSGLADIHEAGFVQGDFTLSNIVIDERDDARIIDINRRGCPIGWEPPELMPLIDADHKISMYISAKTDLYQLGMVLWALAKHDDEPNQYQLSSLRDTGVSLQYQKVASICLNHDPRLRWSASQLVALLAPATDLEQRRYRIRDAAMAAMSGETAINPASPDTRDASRSQQESTSLLTDEPREEPCKSTNNLPGSRASSAHPTAGREPSSLPRGRGRPLHRSDYAAHPAPHRSASSRTSVSSWSTQDIPAISARAMPSNDSDAVAAIQRGLEGSFDHAPLSAELIGAEMSHARGAETQMSIATTQPAPQEVDEVWMSDTAGQTDSRQLDGSDTTLAGRETDQLPVDTSNRAITQKGGDLQPSDDKLQSVADAESDRTRAQEVSSTVANNGRRRSRTGSQVMHDAEAICDEPLVATSLSEAEGEQSRNVRATESTPCALCFQDSGFDELVAMVLKAEQDTGEDADQVGIQDAGQCQLEQATTHDNESSNQQDSNQT